MKLVPLLMSALIIPLMAGCSEQEPPPGPAEQAGKEIDQAIQNASQETQSAMEKAREYTSEKMQEAGAAMEKAGENLRD